MNCLSQRQLARLALGLGDDAELATHLEQCSSCRAGLEAMQAIRQALAASHAKFDQGHEEARERLLALLPAANRPPEPARLWKRILAWTRQPATRRRVAVLGGIAVAALLGFFLLWGGTAVKPLSAMERMAEAIRHVKSYKCEVIFRVPQPGESSGVMESTATKYWLAPATFRYDFTTRHGNRPEFEMTSIHSEGKAGIIIHDHHKTYMRTRPLRKGYCSESSRLDELGSLSGKADRDLGTKEIDGQKAHGFQIDVKKINPDGALPGVAEIWIDPKSNLPVRVGYDWKSPAGSDPRVIMKNIEYNVALGPKLFDTTPPEGYKEITEKRPTLQEQIRQITQAVKFCAEMGGGGYPRTRGDIARTSIAMDGWKLPMKVNSVEVTETLRQDVSRGLGEIADVLIHDSDAAYYGQTVGPNDKDKVLLRWRLDDGRYEVIFGDLRAETVTADRLPALEGK